MENFNCVAVDHNFNDGTCWVHESEKDIVIRDQRFVYGNQYVLNTRCDWSCKSPFTICQWKRVALKIGATLVRVSFWVPGSENQVCHIILICCEFPDGSLGTNFVQISVHK